MMRTSGRKPGLVLEENPTTAGRPLPQLPIFEFQHKIFQLPQQVLHPLLQHANLPIQLPLNSNIQANTRLNKTLNKSADKVSCAYVLDTADSVKHRSELPRTRMDSVDSKSDLFLHLVQH